MWTRDRDVELARRYVAGEPVEQIAQTFGCTEGMVRGRANTLGIKRRKLNSDSPRFGNADWVLGETLRLAIPIATGPFGDDLLAMLHKG